jgi:hypothetical protein
MRVSHLVLVALGASGLGACGFLPPSEQQEFTITGAPPVQTADIFRNANPNLNDSLARLACVEGYEKLNEQTIPVDPGALDLWRVRCAPHQIWFWPDS